MGVRGFGRVDSTTSKTYASADQNGTRPASMQPQPGRLGYSAGATSIEPS